MAKKAKRAPAKKKKAQKRAQRPAAKRAVAKKKPAPKKKKTAKAKRSPRPRPTVPDSGSIYVSTSVGEVRELNPSHAPVDEFTSTGDELLDIFQRYDRDRSGYINRNEFSRLLEGLGQDLPEEELEIALDVVDADRSGRVSWGEFKRWWLSR